MYPSPPLYSGLSTYNTNAVANVGTSHTLVVAPAPGLRIRFTLIWISLRQNEPAANVFRFLIFEDAGPVFYAETILSTPDKGSDILRFDFPGTQINTSGARLGIQSICTAVTRPFDCGAYYYVDQIT